MRMPLALASLAMLSTPAVADEIVSGFVSDTVTVYPEADADAGWSIPSCAFRLPALVQSTSPYLRVQLDSPDGPIWVSASETITEELDAPPLSPSITREETSYAGGTRDPRALAALTEPDTSRSLRVASPAAGLGARDASVGGDPSLTDPEAAVGSDAPTFETSAACAYVPRAEREPEDDAALADASPPNADD